MRQLLPLCDLEQVMYSQFWLGLVAGLVPALMTLMALMALVALAMAMLAILAMPMAVPMAVLWWTLMALAALLVALVARLGRFRWTLIVRSSVQH